MKNTKLLEELMLEKRHTTTAHEKYLSTVRTYLPGSDLYMREAHFVAAASLYEAVSIADIATKLEVTQGAVSQIASRLEKKGYITRLRAKNDRRQTLVLLTESGKLLYKEHLEYDRKCIEAMASLLDDFSDEEIMKIISCEKLFCKVFSNVEQLF